MREKSQQVQLVRRSNILSSPLVTGIALEKELGRIDRRIRRENDRTRAFTGELQRRNALTARRGKITSFVVDEGTGGLIAGFFEHTAHDSIFTDRGKLSSFAFEPMKGLEPWPAPFSRDKGVMIDIFRSAVYTTTITRSRTLIATTVGSNERPTISISQLAPVETTEPASAPDAIVTINLRPWQDTIWTTAYDLLSTSSTERVAIGISDGLHLLTLEDCGDLVLSPIVDPDSDVLAMDWLSQNVLAAGLRNSKVLLWDARSRGIVTRFHHGTPVCNLRRAGSEFSVLTAGFSDNLALYDLRMNRDVVQPTETHGRRKRQALRQSSAQPVLRFPGYANKHSYPLGFEVSLELGLVAAADDAGSIRTMSLNDAKRVRLGDMGSPMFCKESASEDTSPPDLVNCIRFTEDERGQISMLASQGPKILQYVW